MNRELNRGEKEEGKEKFFEVFTRGCLLGYNLQESPQIKLKLTAEKEKRESNKESVTGNTEEREKWYTSRYVSDEMVPVDTATITGWRGAEVSAEIPILLANVKQNVKE